MEMQELKALISRMEDPRRTDRGNIWHKLEDIIIIGLSTLISGGEDFPDMEEFGKERAEWLGTFLELPNGIPDSDTFHPKRCQNACMTGWDATAQRVL